MIVTGGSAGIGGAITTVLIQRGACIVAVDINEDAGRLKAEENPHKIVFFNGDISKKSLAKEAVEIAISKFGKLTGLVNNAHASREKSIMELTEDDWSLSFGTGFYATLQFMQAAYPELKKHKGSIVNFGSGAAMNGTIEQASYAAAKEAIRGMSRVAANEWAQDGIRVNILSPLALTEGLAKWKETNPDMYKK